MGNLVCSKCGRPHKENQKFCNTCGSRLAYTESSTIDTGATEMFSAPANQTACSKCGNLLPQNAIFCNKCGTPLLGQDITEKLSPEAPITPTFDMAPTQVAPPEAAPAQSAPSQAALTHIKPTPTESNPYINEEISSPPPPTDYLIMATQKTPALIIYLLDISGSMNRFLGSKRKIEIVQEALQATIKQMVFRSTKGGRISPRYRLAIYAYSDIVYDVLGGIVSVDEIAQLTMPDLSPQTVTNTALAFRRAESLLKKELPKLGNCPAPLVCHMTDGEYTGDNPVPIAQRIMQMAVPDGKAMVENIFISDSILKEPITDPYSWPGITPNTQLESKYAVQLKSMSSPIPATYRAMMIESNYHLADKALMLLPGETPDLITLGFQMSAATPIR